MCCAAALGVLGLSHTVLSTHAHTTSSHVNWQGVCGECVRLLNTTDETRANDSSTVRVKKQAHSFAHGREQYRRGCSCC